MNDDQQPDRSLIQQRISDELGVSESFDVDAEIESRLGFLADQLGVSGTTGFVLGISGGVDSSTAGRLCQLAVERVRQRGGSARFVAMRLPYGTQLDEPDAQRALAFIRPDDIVTVDVRPASDAMLTAVLAGGELVDAATRDFVLGNIKARQRMIAQYAVAGARRMLVVGTDHAAEAVMGFYTKHGDGACDLTPLSGLTKRRVRALAAALGADQLIVDKTPTADLESDRPGLPDEQVFGLGYTDIDDFLEGHEISPEAFDTITSWHRRSAHKRALPIPAPRG